MANPDFYLCDVCGGHVPKDCRLHIETGREMGPAGSTESVGEVIDLCHVHMKAVLHRVCQRDDNVRASDHEHGKRVVAVVKSLATAARCTK